MFENSGFGRNVDLLHRTMDVSLYRRQVIADNIVNADTPNFKRSEVNFEAELKRVFDNNRKVANRTFKEYLTDEKHIPFARLRDYKEVQPVRNLDYLTTSDNNGNNVDLEQEGMLALQNQLQYEILTRAVNNQFSQVNIVLK